MMKCKDCEYKSFLERKCGPNRYYCDHPEAQFGIIRNALICKTERHSEELTIKTSPKWCPLRRKEKDHDERKNS